MDQGNAEYRMRVAISLPFNQAESVSVIINLNPGCKISIPGISDSLWKYQPAFNYQQLLDSLKTMSQLGIIHALCHLMIKRRGIA